MKHGTLRLEKSSSKTLWLTLTMLFVFSGIAEMLVRTEFFQTPLTPPKMGSSHYQLGHKLALLDAEIKRNGPVNCLMLGSSMTDASMNPEIFQDAYREVTGRDLHCFNFAINASSAASTAVMARILVEDYDPRLLIIGTDPRDYVLPLDDPDVVAAIDSAWIRYRLGDFSLDGWLTDVSYLYRYRQHISRLLRFTFKDTLWSDTKINYPFLPNGYTPISTVSLNVDSPPDPLDTSYEVTYYSRIYSSYEMLDVNLKALEEVMELNRIGTQVIVVEMPVSDGLYYFFSNGEADYNRYVVRVSELADLHQVPFWRTEPLNLIPDDGWSDYSHLNTTGAEAFSLWLGRQVGDALKQDIIQISAPSG
jgi:hypothetical protein